MGAGGRVAFFTFFLITPVPGALQAAEHDFYHLPGYAKLSRATDGGEPVAVWAKQGVHQFLLPLVIRPIPGGAAFDGTSPYGYPGPLVSRDAPPAFFDGAVTAAVAALEARGVISVFVRLHPIINAGLPTVPTGEIVAHGETVVVDLRLTPEEMWKQTRSGHRNEINRALRAGHEFRLDREWRDIQEVARLYLQTMERIGAADYYLFDLNYFESLCGALGEGGMLATVRIDGEVAAGAVFTEIDGLAQYHLSGSDVRFRKQQPTKLLLHELRLHGHRTGWRALHLGGGAGASEDSLFRFKAGFSSGRARFRTWRLVIDQRAYRREVERRGVLVDEPLDLRGFFPSYRAPH